MIRRPSWFSIRQFVCGSPLMVLLLCMWVVGCATGDYAYVKTISTGERLQIPLKRGAPIMATKDDITVRHAGLIPSPKFEDKQLMYLFDLEDKNPVPAKAIRVEDVTDEKTILMVEDLNPKFEKQRWFTTSRKYSGDDPEMVWISQLGDTMRVFRFTVTKADGSKIVLNQGWMVPAWTKTPMRQALGLGLKL